MTLGDIEDLFATVPPSNGQVKDADEEHYNFKIRINRRHKKEDLEKDDNQSTDGNADNFLPGRHSVYVRSMGCTHSVSDGEYLAGLLAEAGYPIVSRSDDADVWILNSCTVKNPSEDHFRNEVEKAKKLGKHLVVSGCVPQGDPKAGYLKDLSVVGVQQIDKVVQVVEETLKGNIVRFMGLKKEGKRKTGGASLHMPKIRRNELIEIIAINTGCLNECTYCKTKHARGNLGSYHPDDIVLRAVTAFSEGVKELWITSEDTGAYGRDIGTNLPELLDRLVEVIPEGCMLRLGMTNPPYILEHLEAIARILSHPRVYSFLHIPVQAGSDQVLGDMKRQYCIEDFCQIVDFLRKEVPGITIATDIICGFPTETEADFAETMELVQRYNFPVLFINQFYPRPGTPAARMKRVATQVVKRRSRQVSDYFNSYQPYEGRTGARYTVLVTEEATDKLHYVGHNKFYEQILIPKAHCTPGDTLDVVIVEHGKHYMIGRPVPRSSGSWSRLPLLLPAQFGDVALTTCVAVLAGAFLYRLYRRL